MAFENLGHGTAVFDGGSQTLSGKYHIRRATWTGFTAVTDQLVITDANSANIVTMTAGGTSGQEPIKNLDNRWVEDLTVTTITHGRLHIYYD
jgi:hypothetical protein